MTAHASAADSPAMEIRSATAKDLEFLDAPPDPRRMEEIKQMEIRSALSATAAPRHWRPVEVDPALLR